MADCSIESKDNKAYNYMFNKNTQIIVYLNSVMYWDKISK